MRRGHLTSTPLCILASAGAGKTRVLTRRIAYRARTGSADPRHTLALTFTRKAAGELQDRLRQLGLREQVSAGTFHAHSVGAASPVVGGPGPATARAARAEVPVSWHPWPQPARSWPGSRWPTWPATSSGPRPAS